MTNKHFDVIIVGSGMGALTSASLFAQLFNKRVLVLEQHFKAGGFTHTFERKGKYEWDVGVHYVGDLHEGSMPRAMMDLVTAGQVKWQKMPENYDTFVYPDFSFKARAGRDHFENDLVALFPEEAIAIKRYLDDLQKAAAWFSRYSLSLALPEVLKWVSPLLKWKGSALALMTTKAYLDKHFQNTRLKALLASQWGDYGLPPEQSSFVAHAMLAGHYLEGAYYPVGGASKIVESAIPLIETAGGQLLVNHSVDEIVVEGGKAIGVKVTHKQGKKQTEKHYYADIIISNVGAYNTYQNLLPEAFKPNFAQDLGTFPSGAATVNLFLGLKEDPRTLGFRGENHWIYDSYNHDAIFANTHELVNGNAHHAYLSFPSLKHSVAKAHTAEILAFIDAKPFQTWAGKPWKRRGKDYEALKQTMTDALLDFVEKRYPGFKNLIDYSELATPLSTETFTKHKGGAIYGMSAVPERFNHPAFSPRTPLKNLYLVGADAAIHGIVGVMMVSASVTGMVAGGARGVMKVFSQANAISNAEPDTAGAY